MAQLKMSSVAQASATAAQDLIHAQQEWTKSIAQSAAAVEVPTGLLDQLSKRHGEIVNAARRSVTGGLAADEAKKSFLDGIQKHEEAAVAIVRSFRDSIGAKSAQEILDAVASLEEDTVKSMASVWMPALPRVDQSGLQQQALFQPPVAEAAAPAWALPTTSIRTSSADRDTEISAALADVRRRQERIEELLQQILDKYQE